MAAGVAALFVSPSGSRGEESGGWPGFLGAGAGARIEGAIPPLEFGRDGKNVLWKVACGEGHSSPCVSGNRLFLTSAEEGGRVLVMTAFDRRDGSVAWERRIDGEVENRYGHRAAHPAMPTACTDGERVFFHFGGYGLIACDVATGDTVWEKRFPFEARTFGTGTSPVLLGDAVVLSRDGTADSAIWCFSAADGSVRWKIPRPGFGGCYATPCVWRSRSGTEIVVPGTNSLRGYDPGDGRLLWSVGGLCVFPCTTPVGDEDRLYFAAWATPNADPGERARAGFWGDREISEEEAEDPNWLFEQFDADGDGRIEPSELPDSRGRDAFNYVDRNADGFWTPGELASTVGGSRIPGRNLMVAIEAGARGELEEGAGIAWTHDEGIPYVPSPLVAGGRVYLVKSGGLVTCLDAVTGEVFQDAERCGVSGEYYATPIAVGDRLLLCSHRGVVLVLSLERQPKVVARNELREAIYATPAVVDGVLYLRTASHLWAVGAPE